MVEYNRYGFTLLDTMTEVTIMQFRHDEFPRFLPIAYPYYVTVFTIMFATFLFIMTFLYADFSTIKGVAKQRDWFDDELISQWLTKTIHSNNKY